MTSAPTGSHDGLYDAHTHVGASDTGQLYYPELTASELFGLMDASGIAQSNIFAPFREGGYREANRTLRETAQASGGRLRALARLGGRRQPVTEPQLWMARRALSKALRSRPDELGHEGLDGFAGVKLLPHLDGMPSRALFRAMRERKLPVLIHAGRYATPTWIARHVLPRTGGPLVLAHLGAFPAQEHLLRDAVALAESEGRVWLDTSGIWIAGFLRYAAARVPHKLIFGSDAPFTHPAVAWDHLARSVPDAGLARRIGTEAPHDVFG
jgi:hypothetical protein